MRISDNNTLQKALNGSNVVYPFFRFTKQQTSGNYFSSRSFEFLCESLIELSKLLSISVSYLQDDDEFTSRLKSLNIEKIYLARDFTPYARKRLKFLRENFKVEEVDDITLHPVSQYTDKKKLKPFFESIPEVTVMKKLPKLSKIKSDGIKFDISSYYKKSFNANVRRSDFESLIKNFVLNLSNYGDDKERKKIGNPNVSNLSAFIKFGIISIREVWKLADKLYISDRDAFKRELSFQDFYRTLAYYNFEDVYINPTWEYKEERPKFLYEYDLLKWKQHFGEKGEITLDEKHEIKEANEIWNKWKRAETEYTLINAAVKQLQDTGYMLNRLRMITCSYICRDNNIWWKYFERYFAQKLIDYDWTINSMNIQNIVKIGLYPKYTQDFKISTQQNDQKIDKQIYYSKYL